MRTLLRTTLWACVLLVGWRSRFATAGEPQRNFGPWNVAALKKTPTATWGKRSGLTQEVYYEGESFRGKPTRIFGYLARPETGKGPFPAILLVHGGGGLAFPQWATIWAKRGYVALAMDTAGQGPQAEPSDSLKAEQRFHLPDGGPNQSKTFKFPNFTDDHVRNVWTYQAVAAVIRGHSLLAAQEDVDPQRIGITGISWGGYLTCIVSGLDDRLKVAIPVYGCGHLDHNSMWLGEFAEMTPDLKARWLKFFDPSRYVSGILCPILFVNGTNDSAYPLDSYQLTYRQVRQPDLCIKRNLPHSHPHGWGIPDVYTYADSILKQAPAYPRLSNIEVFGTTASAQSLSKTPVIKGELNYTTDQGPWLKRVWKAVPATITEGKLATKIPSARPIVFYLNGIDSRGAVASTPHVVLDK
jgi:dienelactone hydrolase